MSRTMPGALSTRTCALRRRACAQDGSFLVEALVSAMILVIVGLGVLKSLDRGSRLGGEQRIQAVAGNVAQTEQEAIRAMPVSKQSNLDQQSFRTIGAIRYTIDSRADWVNDTSGAPSCATAGSKADYMKLTTVVSWPRPAGRKPVKLESLIAPGVRAFDASQGSLAVRVTDGAGDPVVGLPLELHGDTTLASPTNDSGCVLWGYVTAGNGYRLQFQRSPDWVRPDGTQIVDVPVSVAAAQTSNVALPYDQGGYVRPTFVTRRDTGDSELIATNPQVAHVTNSGDNGVSVAFSVASGQRSVALFPFSSSAYTIHADSCAAAEVPVPAPVPVPASPAAPPPVTVTVAKGVTTTRQVQLPSLSITVKSNGQPKEHAVVRVTTPCNTVYRRTTDGDGVIDDPGFPYAASLDVCVSDGTRYRTLSRVNKNFNVSYLTVNIQPGDPAGTCS
jgi:Tfp pilus assembly protein PilV